MNNKTNGSGCRKFLMAAFLGSVAPVAYTLDDKPFRFVAISCGRNPHAFHLTSDRCWVPLKQAFFEIRVIDKLLARK